MTRPTPLFYILHGDDEFTLRAEVRIMRARLGDSSIADLNVSVLDGKAVPVPDIIAAANAVPFLADKRLVIVEGLLSWLTRKAAGKSAKNDLELLAEALPNLPETARLVFLEIEPLKDTHPILKLTQREDLRGLVKECSPPRDPYDREKRRWDTGWVASWIARRVEHYGGRIELRAAAALASVIGQDLYAADSECAKLVTYVGVGSARPITEADVSTMTPYVAEANIFEITDALGQGKSQQALRLMRRLLADPKQQPLSLLSMIARQFRLLIMAREALDDGGSLRDIPEFSRLPERVRGSYSVQAQRFAMSQLELIYRHLLEIDLAIKTGKVATDELALEMFAAGL